MDERTVSALGRRMDVESVPVRVALRARMSVCS